MESHSHEKQDRLICLKAFSATRQTGRSAESIPRIFGKFKNGSSFDDSRLRRTRSFSLPRILKRDKEDKQHFSFSLTFGTKTNQKEPRSSERSSVKGNGQDNRKRLNGGQSYQTNDISSSKQNKLVIPTICIQTPEEVNLILQLHQITLDDSTQLCSSTHDRESHKECPKRSTENNATLLCKTTTSDNSDKRKEPRRKRSASWSGDLNQISPDAVLKHSISWNAFFDSDTSRETDLCSTEL